MCRWNLCFWQADTGAVKALIGWELARASAEAAYLQHIVSFHAGCRYVLVDAASLLLSGVAGGTDAERP